VSTSVWLGSHLFVADHGRRSRKDVMSLIFERLEA
jgi:hypothetical protein